MKRKLAGVLVFLMILSLSLMTVAAFVPPGLQKKGGLPPGIQKRFLNGIVEEEKEEGIVKADYSAMIERIDINSRRIMIQEGTAYLYLLVDEDAKIQLDGKTSQLKDLRPKDEVYLKLNKDNTVIEIEGESTGERETIIRNAAVKTINYHRREITLQHDKREVLYNVKDNAVIEINGVKKEWQDVKTNMKVDAKLIDGSITEIKVMDDVLTYEGRLILKYTGTDPTITLRMNNIDREFDVKKDVDLSKLEVGSIIIIEVENNLVITAAGK